VEDEGWRLRKDGSQFWANVVLTAVRDAHGQLLGFAAVTRDLTERRQAEEALRASEESLARAQRMAHLANWERDVRTGRLWFSAEMYRILGLQPEAFGGTFAAYLTFIYPDDRERVQRALAATLAGNQPKSTEYRLVRPDGAVRVVQAAADVLHDASGQPLRLVGTVQDITERKQLEEEREEWITIITHDLRQPITVILGYAEHLARQLAREGTPAQREAVEYAHTAARNLNRIIGDLLDVSRIETRRLTLQPQPMDLVALLRAIVDRSREMTNGHSVRRVIHGAFPLIAIDPSRFEQVLDNLLTNAAKYGDPGTDIEVRIERGDAEVAIAVANRGHGIAPGDMPRLFSRFYRTPEAQAGRAGGLGLGLYIAKGLVEEHGGRIWAESTPGQTTTFHFTLPLRPPAD
jgi:PAS domain S-box-containing protein